MLPRSERMPEFRLWKRENIKALLSDPINEISAKVRKLA